MKVAIMAGGKGTRLVEETEIRPKPMVEIGGVPILWHIMRHYSHYGHNEFVIALGYKGEYIKDYMYKYCMLQSDLEMHMRTGEIVRRNDMAPDWRVHLVDTGQDTGTGGRLKRLKPLLKDGTFMMTWGDGVSDIDLDRLLAFHRSHGRLATITAVRPPARFGHLEFDGERVAEFNEKPNAAEGWINGAFFVLEPEAIDYVDDDETMWEQKPLQRLAADGELMAYKHESFWQCMDTLRDKYTLEAMWRSKKAPWKVWADA